MISASTEWKNFLKIYQLSSKSDAIKFAQKMTDEQNRNSAMNFLKPSSAQKAKAKARIVAIRKDPKIQAEIKKMVNHPGFMK